MEIYYLAGTLGIFLLGSIVLLAMGQWLEAVVGLFLAGGALALTLIAARKR